MRIFPPVLYGRFGYIDDPVGHTVKQAERQGVEVPPQLRFHRRIMMLMREQMVSPNYPRPACKKIGCPGEQTGKTVMTVNQVIMSLRDYLPDPGNRLPVGFALHADKMQGKVKFLDFR